MMELTFIVKDRFQNSQEFYIRNVCPQFLFNLPDSGILTGFTEINAASQSPAEWLLLHRVKAIAHQNLAVMSK